MRLGLLGLGRIGAFHAETLAGLPAVEELVISDPVPALAEQVAERFGARIARGHDVRLEVHGTRDSLAAGLGPCLGGRSRLAPRPGLKPAP
jgi:predicted dehydrogenase